MSELIHSGEILAQEFMKLRGISMNRLACDLNVPPGRVHSFVHGRSPITAGAALRLGVSFDVFPETWMNRQSECDLRLARRTTGDEIARTVRRLDAA